LLTGEVQFTDAKKRLVLRQLCYWKALHAAAARFAREAFAAQPQLADDLQAGYRFQAACSAVLAGCGQGKDAPPDDKERVRLRQEGLGWLRADLALWSKRLASGKADDRLQVRQTLTLWRSDPDLAGVRDDKALARLPEAERQVWQQFWTEVSALLKKTQTTR
jgi:hypothetical protein